MVHFIFKNSDKNPRPQPTQTQGRSFSGMSFPKKEAPEVVGDLEIKELITTNEDGSKTIVVKDNDGQANQMEKHNFIQNKFKNFTENGHGVVTTLRRKNKNEGDGKNGRR